MTTAPLALEPVVLPVVDTLTRRERDVIALIGKGMSNLEIADELHLSVNSVKTHVRAAYRRIGISRRAQAVVWSVHHGRRLAELSAAARVSAHPAPVLVPLATQVAERARLRRVNGL